VEIGERHNVHPQHRSRPMQRLPAREKRRLLRHVRPYWDVHRHRLPSETLAKLKHLRHRQKLHLHAGRLLGFEAVGNQIRVTWRARGAHELQTLLVDRVVNCTGPDYNVHRSRDPLMRSLLAQGLAVSDPHNLGIRTGSYGALVDATGTCVDQSVLRRPHAACRSLGGDGRAGTTRPCRAPGELPVGTRGKSASGCNGVAAPRALRRVDLIKHPRLPRSVWVVPWTSRRNRQP